MMTKTEINRVKNPQNFCPCCGVKFTEDNKAIKVHEEQIGLIMICETCYDYDDPMGRLEEYR